eukprot:scaffold1808_cov360-Prasinococcus_capsulatus_cf.AAC.10
MSPWRKGGLRLLTGSCARPYTPPPQRGMCCKLAVPNGAVVSCGALRGLPNAGPCNGPRCEQPPPAPLAALACSRDATAADAAVRAIWKEIRADPRVESDPDPSARGPIRCAALDRAIESSLVIPRSTAALFATWTRPWRAAAVGARVQVAAPPSFVAVRNVARCTATSPLWATPCLRGPQGLSSWSARGAATERKERVLSSRTARTGLPRGLYDPESAQPGLLASPLALAEAAHSTAHTRHVLSSAANCLVAGCLVLGDTARKRHCRMRPVASGWWASSSLIAPSSANDSTPLATYPCTPGPILATVRPGLSSQLQECDSSRDSSVRADLLLPARCLLGDADMLSALIRSIFHRHVSNCSFPGCVPAT